MQAYDAARDWGATALEISTSSTSDGVLVCMHDLTYDRTTNTKGVINELPASVLDSIGVYQPQLGPAWTAEPLPRVPLLSDVFSKLGGSSVLCVEAKRSADYPAVVAEVERHDLRDSVVMKIFHTSSHLELAKSAGYPVFAYLGTSDVDRTSIAELGARLDPARDYLGVAATIGLGQDPLPDDLVAAAVATRIPVWVYPVHRRSQAQSFFARGVAGAVSSSIGYSSSVIDARTADSWGTGAIAAGELTHVPATVGSAPSWVPGGILALDAHTRTHMITLGQCAPLPSRGRSFRVDVDVAWRELPTAGVGDFVLAFGHSDDNYYTPGQASIGGYQARLGVDGTLGLTAHAAGHSAEVSIATPTRSAPPSLGDWISLRLDVTPTTVTWSRHDGTTLATVACTDARYRGDYLHVGRSSADGSLGLRNLQISCL